MEVGEKHSVGCGGYALLCPIRCLMMMLYMLLLTTGIGYAQTDLAQTTSRNYSSIPMCCPVNHFLEPSGDCTQYSNDTVVFSPPIDNLPDSLSIDDILREYQALECPRGYYAQHYALDKNSGHKLIWVEDTIYLQWRELLAKKTKDFCVGLYPSGKYMGVSCRPNVTNICADATCVQKCCGYGEVVSVDRGMCIPNSKGEFSFKFQSRRGIEVPEPRDLKVLYRIPNYCETILTLSPEGNTDEEFYLTRSGSLYRPSRDTTLQENSFCLDYFIVDGVTGTQLTAFICSGPGLSTEPSLNIRFYAGGLVVSIFSLALTILCYNLIPKLRTMQDLNQLCHMISLLVGETTLFIGYLFSNHIHSRHCVINSIIEQFALLAAFFWLNVMCFDLNQYIRATLKCIPRSAIQGGRSLRFKCYSAYAWGCPLLLTLATAILHYLPNYPDTVILRPGFGESTCWFYGDLERLAFFYVWIGALFVGNIFMLGHTAFMLYQAGVIFRCGKKSDLEEGENRVSNGGNIEKFWQSFSLFTLMVLCWVTEILSWQIPPEGLWYFTDMINSLQGFFVFVFFIRIKKRRDLVKEALKAIFFRVSQTARKLSRSDISSGAVWHFSKSTIFTSASGENLSQEDAAGSEPGAQQKPVNPSSA